MFPRPPAVQVQSIHYRRLPSCLSLLYVAMWKVWRFCWQKLNRLCLKSWKKKEVKYLVLSSFSFGSLCLTFSGKHIFEGQTSLLTTCELMLHDRVAGFPCSQRYAGCWAKTRWEDCTQLPLNLSFNYLSVTEFQARRVQLSSSENLQHPFKLTPTEAAVSSSAFLCLHLFRYLFFSHS